MSDRLNELRAIVETILTGGFHFLVRRNDDAPECSRKTRNGVALCRHAKAVDALLLR